jgi:hypothetical protein
MTKLLFVQASPRGEQSKSICVAQTYLDALKATNPALEVDVLPLWQTELPAFDGDKVAAKVNVIHLDGRNRASVQARPARDPGGAALRLPDQCRRLPRLAGMAPAASAADPGSLGGE